MQLSQSAVAIIAVFGIFAVVAAYSAKANDPDEEEKTMKNTGPRMERAATREAKEAESPQTAAVLTAREANGPAGVVPLNGEPPARIIIDPPLPGPLAKGRVVIQYRTENLRIEPVFGQAALDVSPRTGHLHITVDDSPWHWLDASGETLTITGLSVGPHKILIELVNANHQTLDYEVVSVNVPERSLVPADPKADGFRKAPPIPGVVP